MPPNSYFLPAGRTGILQAHKTIAASIIQNARFGRIESLETPQLASTVSDFLANIIQLSGRFKNFEVLSKQLEMDLLRGHIKLNSSNYGADITYVTENGEFPLHMVSSTISEIAPISLYLKYIIMPGDMLIIDEPEAHLDPDNQVIFARYVCKNDPFRY